MPKDKNNLKMDEELKKYITNLKRAQEGSRISNS